MKLSRRQLRKIILEQVLPRYKGDNTYNMDVYRQLIKALESGKMTDKQAIEMYPLMAFTALEGQPLGVGNLYTSRLGDALAKRGVPVSKVRGSVLEPTRDPAMKFPLVIDDLVLDLPTTVAEKETEIKMGGLYMDGDAQRMEKDLREKIVDAVMDQPASKAAGVDRSAIERSIRRVVVSDPIGHNRGMARKGTVGKGKRGYGVVIVGFSN